MDRTEIIEWLTGPRDRMEGAALYSRYGKNLRLKRQFAVDDTATAMAILVDEMRNLAGLTERELAALPRKAKGAMPATKPGKADDRVVATVEVKKAVTLRERFPFLNSPDCPDELKVAVADMLTAHDTYKEAHAKLCSMADDADASAMCEQSVERYLQNRGLWEELEHYAATGEILGKVVKPLAAAEHPEDLTALSDVELLRKLQSARTNVSKRRKEQEAGDSSAKLTEALAKWELRRNLLQAEVDRRKKK